MKYLKIFHNQILLVTVFLIAGCATGLNSGISAEIVNIEEPVTVFTTPVEEKIKNTESAPDFSNGEIDTPDPVAGWIDPELESLSPLLFLPIVPVVEIIISKNVITESLYVSSFFGNYELGWDDVYSYGPASEKEETLEIDSDYQSNAEAFTVEPKRQEVSDTIVKDEELPRTIYNERIMNGVVQEKIDILMNGLGWIYLPDQDNLDIEYIGRKFTNNNTIYTFLPEIERDYTLRFQFQNLKDNVMTIEKIYLSIIKELPVMFSVEQDVLPGKENMQIEEKKDLKSTIISLMEKGDSESLSELVPEMMVSEENDIHKLLPEIAELLYNRSNYITAGTILEELILDEYFLSSYDYYLYLLGKIYEQDSPIRNEKISVKYYKMLIDRYPTSLYWEESQGRYRYLKRRYIDLR